MGGPAAASAKALAARQMFSKTPEKPSTPAAPAETVVPEETDEQRTERLKAKLQKLGARFAS